MDNTRAIELLEYIKTFENLGFGATNIALDKAIKSINTIEKIKDIIKEEEHYEVSTDRPNQADYDAVSADKFDRIWKVVSEAECIVVN